MRTRSSYNLPVLSPLNPSTSNPKHRNRRRSKQPFILKESPVDTMADQRTMAELLRAPTEGYAEAIVVPPILAEQFELKHSLINMMTSDQFFGLEKDNPHDHIRWFNKITSTIKYKDVPNSAIKLMLFPFSLARAARRLLEKESPRSILTWEDLVSKFINEFFPPSRTINLRNEILNFQQRFDESFHEAWDKYKDLLRDTFYNALNLADQDSLNSAAGGNLLERRTQDVLTIIKNKSKVRNSRNKSVVSQVKSSDANSNSSSEIAKLTHAVNQQTSACLAAGGNTFPELRDNIQGYVSTAVVNYNQGNSVYRPSGTGSFPSNTIANPKGKLKAITTRSGIILDGPSVPIPPPFINPEEDERVEETLTDQDLVEYTIKVPSPIVKKYKPPSQRDFVLHISITLADALIHIPKYQNMLKALLSNKEKLQEVANTPLNENCSAVILKKLPKKLRDPGKFLIPCGFIEHKCKALANLGASINLMPLSIWKKLGPLEHISTRMTLELANRTICTPAGIARDVFVLVGKFTFPADFVIVDYESDPRVPLIFGRPFLRTARALIDVHGEEMILRDEGGNVLPETLLDLDSTKDLHPPLYFNPLSGSTTSSSSPNQLLEEFADELALITFSREYDDDLYNFADLNNNLVDSMPEMLADEHALDYSSSPLYDEFDDDLFEVESDTKNVYDDPFDSKGEKIKESKLLIDELDLPFITHVTQDKKMAISHASLMIEDFDTPLYELPFFKEVPKSKILLLFSSENEEKVFKPGIHTSEKVHSSLITKLSHQGYKVFKINQILKSPMKNFLFSCGKDTHILDVPCPHFYPLDQFKYGGIWVKLSDPKQALRGRHLMLILSFSNE
nr:reverse transcriptase domain-containing protein [Tanacetum cinerariifolium]